MRASLPLLVLSALGLAACDGSNKAEPNPVTLANHSATPALVKNVMPGVEVFSLLSSADSMKTPTGGRFVYGGSADGAGLLRNADGTFTFVTNHEDNFAVSRIQLDRTFKPVSGQYILDSDAGIWRLCSATLATPEEHGFGPLFLTAGESGPESMIHGLVPTGAPVTERTESTILRALGAWSAENALPLPKTAYPGKTVVVIGDDDSGTYGGQIALYVGAQGDLQNGKLYVMALPAGVTKERGFVVGQRYSVEFKEIANARSLAPNAFNPAAAALGAAAFGRVEDLDYRKDGVGRELYVNVTGQAASGANADYGRSKYGRVYRLTLDPADPTKGTFEVLLDGDDRTGPAKAFQNPDNILVTRNYAYIQEDPNGYGDETHDAYIYQYDLRTGALKVVMELDHRRTDPTFGGAGSRFGSWEYGALLDVSKELGVDDAFVLNLQPHTWQTARFQNADGGTLRPAERQGSQTLVLRGLPR